jgi:type I restriction enzyme, S subunit
MDWPKVQISSLGKIGSGTTPKRGTSGYYGGEIPWVKSGELNSDIITNTEEKITQLAMEKHSALKIIPRGSLLVAMYGATVGQVAFLDIEATSNQAVCHIVPKKNIIDPRYLFHMLKSLKQHWLSRRVGGGQPNISMKIIKETEISLPPLNEQKRIAAILDKAKEVNRGIEQSNSARNTLILSVFSDFFGDPIKNTLQFPFPKLREICTVNQGLQIAQKNRFDEPGENRMKYITIAYINGKKKPDYIEVTNQNVICTPDDILMTRTGNTGQIITDVSGIFHNNFFKVNWNRELLLKEYLCWFFRNENVRGELLKRASTTTIPDLNHGQFYEFNIPLPPINLQQKFVNILEKIKCLENVAGLATNNSLSITQEILT